MFAVTFSTTSSQGSLLLEQDAALQQHGAAACCSPCYHTGPGGAAAVREIGQGHSIAAHTSGVFPPAHNEAADTHCPLLTYYFSAWQPKVQLSARQAQRQGRTAVTVTLPKPSSVSRFMPVTSRTDAGMTHEVVETWEALKGYAMMFSRVNALNQQQPSAPRLFPLPGVAVAAASDTKAASRTDVGRFINEAEAQGRRDLWTETSPGSVLLQPSGQSVAAIADIMGIFYDEAATSITLELDLVHEPHMVSEFIAHGPQTLHAHTSHYHLTPSAGVSVDAARLLALLQASAFDDMPAMHVFAKGCRKRQLDSSSDVFPEDECYAAASFTSPTDNSVHDAGTHVKVQGHVEITGDVGCGRCDVGDTVTFTFNKGVRVVAYSLMPTRVSHTERELVTEIVVGINPFGDLPVFIMNPWVEIVGDGAVVVTISDTTRAVLTPASITVIWRVVSQLSLTPTKAYRHTRDSITITATALDSAGGAVAGAAITLAAVGDCNPRVAQQSAITDATGRATIRVSSRRPGAVAVVASHNSAVAAGPSGVRVVAPASHVIFFDDEADVDHKEREYYGHHNGRYAYTEAYPNPSNAEAYDEDAAAAGSDAQRFAEAATKQALADHDAALTADAAST